MNRDIIELREVVTKLVPLLTGKGLTVTQRGAQAYVRTDTRTRKPVSVNIPNIPDNADESFVLAIHGFIDHEVAHVLITDWNEYGGGLSPEKMANPVAQRRMSLNNITEDTMIEREIIKIFPGSRKNLSNVRKHFLEKVTAVAVKSTSDPREQFSYLLVPMMRALAGHEEMQEFMDDGKYWDQPLVKGLLDKLSPGFLSLIKTCSTTKETYQLALELDRILHEPTPPAPPAPPPPPSSKGPSEDKPEKKAGEGDGDGERDHDETEEAEGETSADPDGEAEGEAEADAKPEGEAEGEAEAEAEPEGEAEAEGEDETEADEAEKSEKDAEGKEEENDGADHDDDAEAEADAGSEDGDSGEDGSDGDDEADEGEAEADQDGDADGDTGEDDASGTDSGDADGDAGDSAGADADAGEEGEGSAGGSDDDGDGEADAGASAGAGAALSDETSAGESAFNEYGDDDEPTHGNNVGVGSSAAKSMFEFEDDAFEAVDLSSAIATLISEKAVETMDRASYNVFSREADRIEPVKVPEKINDKWVPQMEERTRQMTGRMQKDIERIMASQSHVIRTPGHKAGKLHSPSLYRVMQGDPRVFSQKQEHVSKDTAVSLLCDNSGSMGGGKMELAMISAYALSQTLERVKIEHEVLGFTTGNWGDMPRSLSEAMQEDARKSGVTYDRHIPLIMPIYKAFSERTNAEIKRRFAYMMNAQPGLNGNIDGECLEIAAERLAKRPEKRKVMFVLSDGRPAGSNRCEPHLKTVIKDMEKIGIECLGIGIKDRNVSRFYPNHVVINDVDDLPGLVMGEIKRILA